MASSGEIPSSYTLQWDAGIRPTSDAQGVLNTTRLRYRSSCNNCRKSRVKCSGGTPCRRCATSPNASQCIYSISQRHGKHKASSDQNPEAVLQRGTSYLCPPSSSCSSSVVSVPDNHLGFGETLQFTPSQAMSPRDLLQHSTMNMDAFAETPVLDGPDYLDQNNSYSTDLLALLSSGPPKSPASKADSTSCDCYLSNQIHLDHIDLAIKEPTDISLDRILQALQNASTHVNRYLACSRCDNFCPRLLNLAMLHQKQVNLMCAMAKNPSIYLRCPDSDALRFTLGIYQLSERDDLKFKGLAILAAAHNLDDLVAGFDDMARSYQERDSADGSILSDLARLNLKWTLDVAGHLKSRLKVIISILRQDDWALSAGQ
ncbi:hypothetical protein BJ170DRAFT_302603 [Xylariales sp. AK1849]|nr:hypothetical protein BJ170DRAFT_302603 [Xylariales sp. AK1849]